MNAPRSVDVAQALVQDLLDRGVREAVLSPGSRSGPLALALHAADAQGLLRLHVRVDEREAGFLGLGLAKSSRLPVPVVTTSGSAVANLHPALLEAAHAGVQLIAVTADRPARLRGTGANQTTSQPGIFGDLGRAEHINVEFDEPLVEPVEWRFDAPATTRACATDGAPGSRQTLASGPRTVVVAGDDSGPTARTVAEASGWPLIAEPSSGSRTGSALTSGVAVLEQFADRIESVVSFGHPTLTRAVTRLLSRTDIELIHVGTQATFPVPAGPNVTFAAAVDGNGDSDPDWLAAWQQADKEASEALVVTSPLQVARAVAEAVPAGGLLIVGASNPIRDLNRVMAPFPVGERRMVLSNRGLSGIDGTLSTAIGAALARESSRAIAYVGDLTFLHGSNGLLIGPGEPRPDLTIVVANDDGGGIFSSLEQGAPEFVDAFERVWGTPTGADLAALCAGYGIAHRRVAAGDLAAALAVAPTGIEVVEVPIERVAR